MIETRESVPALHRLIRVQSRNRAQEVPLPDNIPVYSPRRRTLLSLPPECAGSGGAGQLPAVNENSGCSPDPGGIAAALVIADFGDNLVGGDISMQAIDIQIELAHSFVEFRIRRRAELTTDGAANR